MKVCILSMQMVDNYGSLLQAYGLKRLIETFDAEVEFMDIKKIEHDYCLSSKYAEKHADESAGKSVLQKFFSKDLFVYIKNKITNRIFLINCKEFREKYLDINKKSSHYELCIIGSDEVFNCLNSGWWGYTSQLFGNIPEAEKVITYAASCGATKYINLPISIKESISDAFENVSSFSVRDQNTYDFVSSFGIENIANNVDPVLVYDFKNEILNSDLPKLPKKYCVIYSYFYRFYKKEEIEYILQFCKKNGLTPLAVQGGQTWCKRFIACNPFECLKVFQNADFVITDTFHGTIFSAKYASKFAVLTRESNYNKLYDLVNRIGIDKHLAKRIDDLEEIYCIYKDEEKVHAAIETERIKTLNYLKGFFNGTE